jgi:CelD/BcsL family acetyltransferase involved in cellulose biosynthesis
VSLRIVLHREIPEDPDLHRQWNDLVLKMERPEVFYTWEWALAVQSAYRASLKPLLFLAYEGDHLAGVASLASDLAGKNVSFLAATTGDYCDFLTQPEQRAEFVSAVFGELGKTNVSYVVLANLPEDSATPAALRIAAGKHRFHVYMRPAYLCAQVELGSGEQCQELKTALAGKKKLRRYLRGMEREGPVTFVHLQSYSEIQAALPEFADAHVQFHRSWFWYQPTFDGRHEENSPGYCLLSRVVIEACDMDRMNVVDLGLGAEGYKERFGNATRQTLYVTATKSWGRHLREIARYRLATALKRSPKVESAVRRVLGGEKPAQDATSETKNI